MAYQGILSPPGGFWQDFGKEGDTASPPSGVSLENTSHFPGHAILDKPLQVTINGEVYYYFGSPLAIYLLSNTVVLIGSLCTIMLALSGFPNHNKFLIWLLVFTVYITISCLALSYLEIITLVFPEAIDPILGTISGLVYCFNGTFGFVVLIHACHFLVWLGIRIRIMFVWMWNKFGNLIKTCHISRGPRAWETHTIRNEVNRSRGQP